MSFDHLHHHFACDWMVLTQDLTAIQIRSQKEGFTTKEFASLNRRIKTVDKDIRITYRFIDMKFSQPIIT